MSGSEPPVLPIDHILKIKRQQLQRREARTPLGAVLSLAAMQDRPRDILNYVDDHVALIGQVTHTTPMYDPVAAAMNMIYEGADGIAFFTDHEVYNDDLEDMFLVARACRMIPVIYQNYIINAYHVAAARVANASGLMFHAETGDTSLMRTAVTTAQRFRFTVFVNVESLDQIDAANALSPHVICYSSPASVPLTEGVQALATLRQHVPHHTKLMLGHTLHTLDDVEIALSAGVRAIIVSAGLMRGQNAHTLRQWVGR